MNILQILPRLETGGVERGTLEIAEAVVQRGDGSFVASAGGKMVTRLVEGGTKHITMQLDTKNPFKILLHGWQLSKVIKQHDIQIVHARSRAPAWSALLAARIAGAKFVTTFHGRYGVSSFFKRFYNSVMARGDKVIAVSDFIADHIRHYYSQYVLVRDLVTIHRGVDLNYFNPDGMAEERLSQARLHVSDDGVAGTKILLPGRITRGKGHLYLLDILSKLSERDWICYIVGNYTSDHLPYVKELHGRILELGFKDKVIILPDWHDMPALYAVVDVVVSVAAIPEAFGRTMLEAQAMGRVVVANAHGGALEIISHQDNGFHLPLDDADLAALVLHDALNLDHKAKELISKAGRRNAARYSLAGMCQKTTDLYKSLLD